jgi:hypothetical protein
VKPAVTLIDTLPVSLNMEEAQRQLGNVSRRTIYNWVKAGKLRKVDVPGVFLVSTESVFALVNPADNPADISAA